MDRLADAEHSKNAVEVVLLSQRLSPTLVGTNFSAKGKTARIVVLTYSVDESEAIDIIGSETKKDNLRSNLETATGTPFVYFGNITPIGNERATLPIVLSQIRLKKGSRIVENLQNY